MDQQASADDSASILRVVTSELEGLQGEIERLAKVRARAAAELHEQGASHRKIAESLGVSPGRVAQLLRTNSPETVAVLRAWVRVRGKLSACAEALGIPARLAVKPGLVIEQLERRGLIDRHDVEAIRKLQERRAGVLQAKVDVDQEEADDISVLGDRMVSRLNLLTEDEMSDQLPKVDSPVSCFVIGPIGNRLAQRGSPERARYEKALRVWEEVIRPACNQVGIEPVRADTITRTGEITDQIFRFLRDADVVIADVTGGNANVMYELGLRHTTGKLTIQIGEQSRLPFDVQAVRTILFNQSELGYVDAREELAHALITGLAEGFDPVAAARVWQEGTRLSEMGEDATQDEDEELGFLEILAEAEEAMPLMGEALERIGEITKEVGDLSAEATAKIEDANSRGAGVAARLVITRQLANVLMDPAARMQAEADSYSELMRRVDPGVSHLLTQLENSEDARAEAGEYIDAIDELSQTTRESLQTAAELIESLKEAGRSSRDLARTNRLLIAAIQQVIDDSAPIQRWGERVRQLREGE